MKPKHRSITHADMDGRRELKRKDRVGRRERAIEDSVTKEAAARLKRLPEENPHARSRPR